MEFVDIEDACLSNRCPTIFLGCLLTLEFLDHIINDLVRGILELAKESEHPRTYEVAGQLIKNVAEVTEKLGDLQKKMKDLKELPNTAPKNVTNALFVGSTTDLQKMLRDKK